MAAFVACQPLTFDNLENYESYSGSLDREYSDCDACSEVSEPAEEPPASNPAGPMPVLSLYRRMMVSNEMPSWAAYLPEGLRESLERGDFKQPDSVTRISSDSTTASLRPSSKLCAALRPPSSDLSAALKKLAHLEEGEKLSAGFVWALARNPKGCRDVQNCLENAATEKARVALAHELQGHVWDALRCPHANYVLQKVICLLKPSDMQFVVDEVVGKGVRAINHAARHKYGCRIIQRMLEHCTPAQVGPMVDFLLSDAVVTAMHPYGNYVMQHVIEYGSAEQRGRVAKALAEHVEDAGRDDYACAVLSKAMVNAEPADRASLAAAIARADGLFASMACSGSSAPATATLLRAQRSPTSREQIFRQPSCRSGRICQTSAAPATVASC
eukprot:TRINITY_DN15133_c0_g1_i3.p1 TRINITY_DN15133_c0_g1~~TRINITY_DN15133_c0_g1_i3.p1  ORF type:complete len:387 (+),score=78.74 TRINITY_DN15133_c0_g1_i3:72-1232(+)